MPDGFHEFNVRLTDNAKESLQHSEAIARSMGSAYIGTEHLLLGVLSQDDSVGAKILSGAGITLDRAQLALNLTPRNLVVGTGARGLSETAKLTLKMSWEIAREFHQDYCGTEHILYSILNQKNARATVLLRDMSVSLENLTAELEDYLNAQQQSYENLDSPAVKKRSAKKGALDIYGTDLTAAARNDELDSVIGREEQIDRMVTILSRRTKNNPVLIGDPGVGKTAIVEGLAHRIVNEQVPDHLFDKKIIQLDLASMIAGTKYRGEFEERLKKVLSEIATRSDVIIFIDELHLLVGAGAAEGALDAANIMKPALARGKLHMIGATTTEEYRKYIEKDAALERRLQPIVVPEPSIEDTVAILKGLRHHYESYHNVRIEDAAIEDAARLADRYVTERFMPDKAIDVLDEAASHVKVRNAVKAPESRRLQKEIAHLSDKMDDAVANEDYERAALYKTRLSQLSQRQESVEKETAQAAIKLSTDDVAHAVAMMTGIPVTKVVAREARRLRSLEVHLAKRVIGQKEAISQVARAMRRGRSGIASHKRPVGSFIFMGPTGVGKTELTRVLAQEVYGSDKALIKIDMSELGERHAAARLVGAPAGYVGYDDSNQLTDKVRRQPYSVILFDEVEKAHPDVLQLLLQVLEDGQLTDGKGRHVDFSNTTIILTSNLGAEAMQREASLGFKAVNKREAQELAQVHQENEIAARQALDRFMKPELINRFDSVVVFRALTRYEVGKIADLQIEDLRQRLHAKNIGLEVSNKAKKWLVERGYDEKFGARPLRRVLQDTIEHSIADGILSRKYRKGVVVFADIIKGQLVTSTKDE